MAAEQAIFDQIARAETMEKEQPQKAHSKGGRPSKVDPIKLVAWRHGRNATIAATAKHWNVSEATVKRLSREYTEAAEAERQRYQMERLSEAHEYDLRMMYLRQRSEHLSWVSFRWLGAEEAARGTPKEDAVMAAKEAALDEADRQFREEWEQRMRPVPGLSHHGE